MGDQKHRWVQVAEAILSQYSVIIRLARPNDTRKHCRPLVCCSTGQALGPAGSGDRWWRPLQWPRAMQHCRYRDKGRVVRWRLSWCSALAQYDVYTAAANISPSLHQDTESGSEGSSYYNIDIYILFTASISSDFSSMISYDTHFKLDLWNWGLSIFFPSPRWAACHMCAGAVLVDAESWLQPASD